MATKDVMIRLLANTSQAITQFNSASKAISGFGTSAQTQVNKTSQSINSLAIAFTGISGVISTFVGKAISDFAKFETEISLTSANLFEDYSTTFNEVDDITQQYITTLVDLSNQSGKTATDLAKGLYEIVSSGAQSITDASQATDILTQSMQLAIVGGSSLETAVDAVVSTMNAYVNANVSASEAADVLFGILARGRGRLEELASAFPRVATLAAAAGVSLEDLGIVLAQVTRSGLRVEEAVTAVRGVLNAIIRPTEQTSAAMAVLGTNFTITDIETKGLVGTFSELADAYNELNQEGQAQFIELLGDTIPNIRGLVGAISALNQSLANSGQELDKDIALFEQLGIVTQKYEDRINTVQVQLERVASTFENLGIKIVGLNEGPLLEFLKMLSSMFEYLQKLPDSVLSFIGAFVGVATIVTGLGAILAVISAIGVAIGTTGAALAGWILGLSGVGAIVLTLIDDIKEFFGITEIEATKVQEDLQVLYDKTLNYTKLLEQKQAELAKVAKGTGEERLLLDQIEKIQNQINKLNEQQAKIIQDQTLTGLNDEIKALKKQEEQIQKNIDLEKNKGANPEMGREYASTFGEAFGATPVNSADTQKLVELEKQLADVKAREKALQEELVRLAQKKLDTDTKDGTVEEKNLYIKKQQLLNELAHQESLNNDLQVTLLKNKIAEIDLELSHDKLQDDKISLDILKNELQYQIELQEASIAVLTVDKQINEMQADIYQSSAQSLEILNKDNELTKEALEIKQNIYDASVSTAEAQAEAVLIAEKELLYAQEQLKATTGDKSVAESQVKIKEQQVYVAKAHLSVAQAESYEAERQLKLQQSGLLEAKKKLEAESKNLDNQIALKEATQQVAVTEYEQNELEKQIFALKQQQLAVEIDIVKNQIAQKEISGESTVALKLQLEALLTQQKAMAILAPTIGEGFNESKEAVRNLEKSLQGVNFTIGDIINSVTDFTKSVFSGLESSFTGLFNAFLFGDSTEDEAMASYHDTLNTIASDYISTVSGLNDQYQTDVANFKEAQNQKTKDLAQSLADQREAIGQSGEQEKADRDKKYQEELADLQAQLDNELISQEQYNDKVKKAEVEYQQDLVNINKDSLDQKTKDQEAYLENLTQSLQDSYTEYSEGKKQIDDDFNSQLLAAQEQLRQDIDQAMVDLLDTLKAQQDPIESFFDSLWTNIVSSFAKMLADVTTSMIAGLGAAVVQGLTGQTTGQLASGLATSLGIGALTTSAVAPSAVPATFGMVGGVATEIAGPSASLAATAAPIAGFPPVAIALVTAAAAAGLGLAIADAVNHTSKKEELTNTAMGNNQIFAQQNLEVMTQAFSDAGLIFGAEAADQFNKSFDSPSGATPNTYLREPSTPIDTLFGGQATEQELQDANAALLAIGQQMAVINGLTEEEARLAASTYGAQIVDSVAAAGGSFEDLQAVIESTSASLGVDSSMMNNLVNIENQIEQTLSPEDADAFINSLKDTLANMGIEISKTATNLQGVFIESGLPADQFFDLVVGGISEWNSGLSEVSSSYIDLQGVVIHTSQAMQVAVVDAMDVVFESAEGLTEEQKKVAGDGLAYINNASESIKNLAAANADAAAQLINDVYVQIVQQQEAAQLALEEAQKSGDQAAIDAAQATLDATNQAMNDLIAFSETGQGSIEAILTELGMTSSEMFDFIAEEDKKLQQEFTDLTTKSKEELDRLVKEGIITIEQEYLALQQRLVDNLGEIDEVVLGKTDDLVALNEGNLQAMSDDAAVAQQAIKDSSEIISQELYKNISVMNESVDADSELQTNMTDVKTLGVTTWNDVKSSADENINGAGGVIDMIGDIQDELNSLQNKTVTVTIKEEHVTVDPNGDGTDTNAFGRAFISHDTMSRLHQGERVFSSTDNKALVESINKVAESEKNKTNGGLTIVLNAPNAMMLDEIAFQKMADKLRQEIDRQNRKGSRV